MLYEKSQIVNKHSTELKGTIALIAAALFWGIEFVVEKDILFYYGANWSNTIRFAAASLVFLFVWRGKFKTATVGDWKKGMISGAAMGMGYSLQTMGLQYTSPGVNAFLCSAYIILIPFLAWYVVKRRPQAWTFFSVIIAVFGVFFMSTTGLSLSDVHMGIGEILTLLGSFFYAAGIVSCDYYAKNMDTKLLAGMQCIGTLLVAVIMAAIFEPLPNYLNGKIVLEFIYLILFASMFTQVLFTYGMRYVPSHKAGLIFLIESSSAMILGWIFMHDPVIISQIIGGILIIIAIVISNLKNN